MNYLITGGCGFIGRVLITHLFDDLQSQFRVYDNLSVGTTNDLELVGEFNDETYTSEVENWKCKLSLIVGDILDVETLERACQGADVIVHLAANTGVGPSVIDPMQDCLTNVIGTLNVLEAARNKKVQRVVFASSGAPLGVQEPPLNEEMAPHPASPYGASKLAGEGYCSAYYHCFGVEAVVLRFGNVYGPGSTKKDSVIAKFIKQAMAGETLEIYGDGSQTRDFIYIDDLVEAIHRASTAKNIGGEVFQIATSAETIVGALTEKLVKVIGEETGLNPSWVNGETRDGDVARNYSDTSKAKEKLNWSPSVDLEDGLRKTVQYFNNQTEAER